MTTFKRILMGVLVGGWLMAAGPTALTIPKNATANPDGTYSWTDKQGKKWTYVKTPFGISRTMEAGQPAPKQKLPAGIPAGAKGNADGTYSYTDKAGAKWTYVITPFGPSRSPAAAEVNQQNNTGALAVKVIDKGDTVRFERPTPFGASVWEKRKTDLTDEERHLIDVQAAETPKAN